MAEGFVSAQKRVEIVSAQKVKAGNRDGVIKKDSLY